MRLKPPEEPVVTITRAGEHVDAVRIAVVPGDPLAERPDAERLGIAEPAASSASAAARKHRRAARARRAGRPPCG